MATIGNFDGLTGENEIIEISDAELKKLTDANQVEQNLRNAEKATREADKASATAKLEALGLTANDLKALGL